jgi:serine/threonine protein kinase
MRSLLASVRREDGYDRVDSAVRSLEGQWRHGEPKLERYWADHDPDQTTSVLAALVKADLRCRFARGNRPSINDYLERFPQLREASERVLSLIYEEFCLREEQGEQLNPESFCDRYPPWRDSLASQLKYHQLLSRVVGPTAPAPRFPEPGEHFQEFSIDSVLGQGGAARVYRARNDLLGGQQVAIKVSPDRGQEPSILGRLRHEHIVPVHNVVFQHDTHLRGLIMPYRPGLPLDEVIRRVKPATRPGAARVLRDIVEAEVQPDEEAVDSHPGWTSFPERGTYAQGVAWVIGTLARAVACAHAHEIHHRDIKPANILLTVHHGPQLLDFNLAYDPHAADQAEAALRGGTLPYMAPEQLEAFIDPERWNAVGPGADIYSLGLVMFELLTGLAPEVPDQSIPLPRAIRGLLDRRLDQRFVPRQLNPSIPHALEAITLRCLTHDEADRYPSAQALAEDLELFLKDRPLRYAENPSSAERLRNWTRRNWYVLAASVMVGMIGSYCAIAYLYLSPVERARAFRAALEAVEKGDDERALGLLGTLDEQYPHDPLVLFHYSLELAQAGKLQRAAEKYAQALQAPRAEKALDEWAKKSPNYVTQLESLGFKLGEAKKKVPTGRIHYPLIEQAHRAITTAIRLGPTNERVFVEDALYYEKRGEYDLALSKLSARIELLQANPRGPHHKTLNDYNWYQYRARILTRLGFARFDDGSPEALREAKSYYDRAFADLTAGRSLIQDNDAERLSFWKIYFASARVLLGFLAIHQARLDEAQALYAESEENLRVKLPSVRLVDDLKFSKDRLAELDSKIHAHLPRRVETAQRAHSGS